MMRTLAAAAPILVSVLVLLGWEFDFENFKRIDMRLVAMNPVTALGLFGGGLGLLILQLRDTQLWRRIALALGLLLCAIGTTKILMLAGVITSGPDTLFYGAKLDLGSVPNRMAPNTAFNFVLVGGALSLLAARRAIIASQLLAVCSALVSMLAIVGYLYGITQFYGVGSFIPMAIHTATSFLLLSGAALYLRPQSGLMNFITNEGPAGRMARILLPCVILLPIAMGWLRLLGQRAGLYQSEVGVAVFVMANVLIFVLLIWWNARQLYVADLERRRAELQLMHVATHDALTGLANRAQFLDRLSQRMNRARRHTGLPFGVLFLDLDGFKQVNDRLGHGAGDQLLQQVAGVLKQCARTTDLVARMGGDEFTILAEDLTVDADVRTLANRILAAMPSEFVVDHVAVPIGISIGIAVYSSHHSADALLVDADVALYQAKREGKGRYVVFEVANAA